MFRTYIPPAEFNVEAAQFRPNPRRGAPEAPPPQFGVRLLQKRPLEGDAPTRVAVPIEMPAPKVRKTDRWERPEYFRGAHSSGKKFDEQIKNLSVYDRQYAEFDVNKRWSIPILDAAIAYVKRTNLPVMSDLNSLFKNRALEKNVLFNYVPTTETKYLRTGQVVVSDANLEIPNATTEYFIDYASYARSLKLAILLVSPVKNDNLKTTLAQSVSKKRDSIMKDPSVTVNPPSVTVNPPAITFNPVIKNIVDMNTVGFTTPAKSAMTEDGTLASSTSPVVGELSNLTSIGVDPVDSSTVIPPITPASAKQLDPFLDTYVPFKTPETRTKYKPVVGVGEDEREVFRAETLRRLGKVFEINATNATSAKREGLERWVTRVIEQRMEEQRAKEIAEQQMEKQMERIDVHRDNAIQNATNRQADRERQMEAFELSKLLKQNAKKQEKEARAREVALKREANKLLPPATADQVIAVADQVIKDATAATASRVQGDNIAPPDQPPEDLSTTLNSSTNMSPTRELATVYKPDMQTSAEKRLQAQQIRDERQSALATVPRMDEGEDDLNQTTEDLEQAAYDTKLITGKIRPRNLEAFPPLENLRRTKVENYLDQVVALAVNKGNTATDRQYAQDLVGALTRNNILSGDAAENVKLMKLIIGTPKKDARTTLKEQLKRLITTGSGFDVGGGFKENMDSIVSTSLIAEDSVNQQFLYVVLVR